MYSLPFNNVPVCKVFLPITIDFPGPKDDFDLSVTLCAEIRPIQGKIKSRKRDEKQQERVYIHWPTARLQRYAEPPTVYIRIS